MPDYEKKQRVARRQFMKGCASAGAVAGTAVVVIGTARPAEAFESYEDKFARRITNPLEGAQSGFGEIFETFGGRVDAYKTRVRNAFRELARAYAEMIARISS